MVWRLARDDFLMAALRGWRPDLITQTGAFHLETGFGVTQT